MDILAQVFTAQRLETAAQIAAAVFVGLALRRDAQAREFQTFIVLDERWSRLAEQRRMELPNWPEEKVIAWGWQLLSFGELVAMMVNTRRLNQFRLRLHFSAAMDLVQQWMEDPRFSNAHQIETTLPEFKMMRLHETRRPSLRRRIVDRLIEKLR